MKKLFTLFVIIALPVIVFGQSPQRMSYQAVVRNTSGVLMASQSVGMRISILQGSATGTAVYVETHTTTTNANGLATIEIGGGTYRFRIIFRNCLVKWYIFYQDRNGPVRRYKLYHYRHKPDIERAICLICKNGKNSRLQ